MCPSSCYCGLPSFTCHHTDTHTRPAYTPSVPCYPCDLPAFVCTRTHAPRTGLNTFFTHTTFYVHGFSLCAHPIATPQIPFVGSVTSVRHYFGWFLALDGLTPALRKTPHCLWWTRPSLSWLRSALLPTAAHAASWRCFGFCLNVGYRFPSSRYRCSVNDYALPAPG